MFDTASHFVNHAIKKKHKISVWVDNRSIISLSANEAEICDLINSFEKCNVRVRSKNSETICWVHFKDFGDSVYCDSKSSYYERWNKSYKLWVKKR